MNMLHSSFSKSIVGVLALATAGITAPPLEKTGPCPTLTRYTPTDKNWVATQPAGFGGKITPPTSLFASGTVQNPLSADSSINCIIVPAGLKVQLLASEKTPGLNSALPLAYIMEFTFDEKGRTWAVEPRDYPYTHDTLGVPTGTAAPSNRTTGGRGRILILTDVDGDGSLDNYKVFYNGLVIPTSVELVKGGVIAIVPPSIYFIPASSSNPDTAGGSPQIIVKNMNSGGTSYDTHGQTNSLTWGIDNYMYGGVGYNSCGSPRVLMANGDSTAAASSCNTGSIYRFKSKVMGSDSDFVQVYGASTSGTNSHGIGQSEDGQWFSSKATVTNHSHHVVRLGQNTINILPTSYSDGGQDHNFYPATRDYYAWEGSTSRTFTVGGQTVYGSNSSAVSGHDFYTATLLPSQYRTYSFVCEGMTHLCNQNVMTVNGSTWRATRMPGPIASNIFSSTDAWVAPLKVRTGPDGALWVLDFYNYLFLHNPATPSTNSAWNNALRAKSRVRIYRIVPTDGPTQPVPNLSYAPINTLVAALGHSNMFWRTTAQRLLLNRFSNYSASQRTALLDSLHKILNTDLTVDTTNGTSPKVLHAMWTVSGLRAFTWNAEATRWDTTFKKLLLHPAWTVRRNAILAMPVTQTTSDAFKAQCAVNDAHAHVRIQALAQYILLPAPTGGAAEIVASYQSTDTYSTAAVTAAGATKVTSVAGTTRPGTCPAYSTPVVVTPGPVGVEASRNIGRNDLRFDARDGGFVLRNNLQLGSGQLVVSDLRGKVVFRSTYNASKATWSTQAATNLSLPVYFYTFREIGGASFNGRIALNSGF
jgi:putative membrane-bound dehydrogenase-like protein